MRFEKNNWSMIECVDYIIQTFDPKNDLDIINGIDFLETEYELDIDGYFYKELIQAIKERI